MARRLSVLILALTLAVLLPPWGAGKALAQGCGGTAAAPRPAQVGPRERWRLSVEKAGSLHPLLVTDKVVVVAAYGRGCALSILSLRGWTQ